MASYPISNVTRRVVYVADGVGPYAFTFEILAQTDVAVFRDDTLLTLTTDYTVVINANGTGTITLTAVPTGATQIAIVGARAIERVSDFTTGGDFFANTVNEELDSITIFAQQNAEAVDRALQAPQTDPTTIDMTLPRASVRAGKYLSFDVDGNPVAAEGRTEVAGVFAIRDEIVVVAGISTEVVAVDANEANINTVAGINANVTTVAGISGNVTTVATNTTNVNTVATNIASVNTVSTNITNVNNVGGNIAAVLAVNANQADIDTVAANLGGTDTIGTVAGSIANVNAVGTDIANVNTVAGELGVGGDVTVVSADLAGTDTVGTVAGSIANVNTTAGSIANVNTVAGNIANVNIVAGNNTNVTTVAGISGNVTTVAGINANVTTVAGISSNVTAVASNSTNVNTVATNIAAVNTAATNIAVIQAAPTQAANAAASAAASAFSASAASDSADAAATSAETAAAATNAVLWVSGTTYAIGFLVYSPLDNRVYRRLTAGAGTTDPSADATNWVQLTRVVEQADIGTAPNEIPLNQYLGSMAYQSLENVIVENLTVTGQLNARQDLLVGSFTWNSFTSTPDSVFGRQQIVTGVHDKIRGCVLNVDGTVNYYLNPETWAQKDDGTASVLTGADGNVMVEIPKFYYRQERSGTTTTWKVSAVGQSGYKVHPAFIKDGVEVDFRYYGAYDACYLDATDSVYKSGLNLDDMTANLDLAADKLASVKGIYPLVGVTRAETRSLAANVGTGWRQLDFTLWSAVQMLYLIEYQSFFSQDILGAGNTNGTYLASSALQSASPHTIAGAGDAIANGSTNTVTGAGVSAKPGTSFMKYRGIENLYGNSNYCPDGINVNVTANGNVWVTNNAADWADDTATNYTLITSDLPTASGFIRNLLPIDGYFLSSLNAGGSSTTFITDQHFAATGNRVVIVGGGAALGATAGAFFMYSNAGSSTADRTLGARLAY